MRSQILVPLDGSAAAEAILPAALHLARATSGTLTLLRVVPPPRLLDPLFSTGPSPALSWAGLPVALNVARHYLDSVVQRLPILEDPGTAAAPLPVQIAALPGNPAATIVDYVAQRPSVQWIAMTTHGRSGIARWLYGSVAEQVLHTAGTPLLLLRPALPVELALEDAPNPDTPWHHIVVALDGSALAEQALPQAQRLAAAAGATLDLVSALPQTSDPPAHAAGGGDPGSTEAAQRIGYLVDIAQRLRAGGLAVQIHGRFGEPRDVIVGVAAELPASVIVLATHGRSGFQQLRLGSVALQVVHHARQPVLLVRATLPAVRHAA